MPKDIFRHLSNTEELCNCAEIVCDGNTQGQRILEMFVFFCVETSRLQIDFACASRNEVWSCHRHASFEHHLSWRRNFADKNLNGTIPEKIGQVTCWDFWIPARARNSSIAINRTFCCCYVCMCTMIQFTHSLWIFKCYTFGRTICTVNCPRLCPVLTSFRLEHPLLICNMW